MEQQQKILSPKERRLRNRERNRDEMKAAILDAARAVMREEGVAALNLQEVARRVGMRAPSLYEYFPGKMAIYDALFRLGVRLYAQRLAQLAQQPASLWQHLRAALEIYLSFAQESPELYQLVFERPVPGFVPSEESLRESRRSLAIGEEVLQQDLERAGIALSLPLAQARDLVIAMMHGLAAQHLANEPELPVGSGRFGSLIPAAVALFQASWDPQFSQSGSETATDSSDPSPHSQE